MEQKRGGRFLEILNSKPVIGALIFIFLSLTTVFAGNVIVNPNGIQSDNYYSSDGTAGLTQDIPFRGIDGNNYTFIVKNGLIVGTTYYEGGGGNGSAWWNPSWSNCKNITITTSLNRKNAIMEYNITGITFSNITEIRIINASCGNNGTEVKSSVLMNGSNWALTTWSANLSGSSVKYSVYYNNPTNPVKLKELVADHCEFDKGICNFRNSTTNPTTNGLYWKLVNATGGLTNAGGYINFTMTVYTTSYSTKNISASNILIKENNYINQEVYGIGISNETANSAGFYSPNSIYYGSYVDTRSGYPRHSWAATKNGLTAINEILHSGTTDYGLNKIGIYWFKVNSTFAVNASWYNTTNMQTFTQWSGGNNNSRTLTYTQSNLHLAIFANDNLNRAQILDYIRAYDKESEYVLPSEMPTFGLGAQESH